MPVALAAPETPVRLLVITAIVEVWLFRLITLEREFWAALAAFVTPDPTAPATFVASDPAEDAALEI